MEEMERIKKELKKDLIKELGKDEMSGRFYMNIRQMELRTATIFISNIYKESSILYDSHHNEFTGKQLNEINEKKYEEIARIIEKYQNKYNYAFVKEIKEYSGRSIAGQVYIRLYFK